MRKIKLEKIVENLLDKLRNLYTNGTVIFEIFSLPQAVKKSRRFFLLRTDIVQKKQSLGAPDWLS